MTSIVSKHAFPELFSRPTAHQFGSNWDSIAVARIINDNSDVARTPAFLFLGRKEAELLRANLGEAWGEKSVTSFHQIYYMGLNVVTVDVDSYISTGGSKGIRKPKSSGLRLAS